MPKASSDDFKARALDFLEEAEEQSTLPTPPASKQRAELVVIQLSQIQPDPNQPRKTFDESTLNELASSIKESGVIQPLVVSPLPDGTVKLIAGERRFRAAQIAGLEEVPATIRSGDDALEIALIENLQREDLHPIEEAEGLARLKQERQYTDEMLAAVMGKSRSAITETLSLTKLPASIVEDCRALDNREIATKTKLVQLVRIEDASERAAIWDLMKRGEATTLRQVKDKVKKPASNSKGRPKLYTFRKANSDYEIVVRLKKSRGAEAVCRALEEALSGKRYS